MLRRGLGFWGFLFLFFFGCSKFNGRRSRKSSWTWIKDYVWKWWKIQGIIELVCGCIKILGVSYAYYKKLYLVKMCGLLGVVFRVLGERGQWQWQPHPPHPRKRKEGGCVVPSPSLFVFFPLWKTSKSRNLNKTHAQTHQKHQASFFSSTKNVPNFHCFPSPLVLKGE